MTEHAHHRVWSGIDIPKTIAGTLAAVSAAVVGSFLGVAGTLIGAAVASLISSVGTEIYHRYLERGTKKLQTAFVTAPAAVGTPEVAAAPQPPSDEPAPARQIRWKRISLVAASLFVLAMGTLTAAELLAGRSAADATGGKSGGAPTVFNWTGNDSSSDADTDKPAPASSTTPAGADPSTEPAAEPSSQPDQGTATTAPADPGTATTEPAAEPTTEAPAEPEPTTGADTDQGTAELPEQ
ncbi:hypothetical protein [Actinoplanes palleronii]|uniref:Uncharacterized protein n=1 Tax=Actinoplanes palleronii TaxID=113570 RepID=A0ABQ4BFB3_9ACTN|nr:hypothetical protein [Actinoplanes palleronii]GIE69332.1 hypothetical protein Apa02nite_054400 [Actinoplanes palleronii]